LGHNAGGIEVALARAGKHVIREALRTFNIYAEIYTRSRPGQRVS